MNKNERQKKIKEWCSISNILPKISKKLEIEISEYNEEYLHEQPDFLFSNKNITIGVEVVECHPSSATKEESFDKKICNKFKENSTLLAITQNQKISIIIDKKERFKKGTKIQDVCKELVLHLLAWKNNNDMILPSKFINRIRVIKTKGKNIVYFNYIARRIPVSSEDLVNCIIGKNKKNPVYSKKNKKENGQFEIWLCINLPREENIESNNISYPSNEKQTVQFISKSPFQRIYVTSEMPQDIKRLK